MKMMKLDHDQKTMCNSSILQSTKDLKSIELKLSASVLKLRGKSHNFLEFSRF